eukprot:gnl/MRDRNA2_/MRDRNA2_102707_c0_seq1.p1 gnl/MRDRNA2_/MRDRNA2_102707_c0~~gnl/MRDRNA2_/MRDRNA2_102707_c0_seq1.p1  ORF type:complete len:224 (-),score=55.63 gnl/MRDRNA2_/MRDRNA2_102707_c0_seq1:103-774(-)
MLRVVLGAIFFIGQVRALTQQEGKNVETMSFGQEKKQHPTNKEKLKNSKKEVPADVPVVHFTPKAASSGAASLAQLHSLSIQKKSEPAASAIPSKALRANPHLKVKEVVDTVNATMVLILVAAGVIVLFAVVIFAKSGHDGYKSFGDRSGLSTSSSEITSSETGSTDRELKNRMDRFEKRLEEHKRMLEVGESTEGAAPPSTGSNGSNNGNGGQVRLTWMQKK